MKILVVNLMQIGDLVLTTPVFKALKLHNPNNFIAAAVNKQFAQLVQFNPFLNRVFTIDKHSLSQSFHTLKLIRRERFDLCINLNRSERACAVSILSGANLIIGYSKSLFYPFFDSVCPNLKRSVHQIISHFNVLDKAGFHDLPIPNTDVFIGDTNLDSFMKSNFPHKPQIVAFNVGASWLSKRWLPEYFAKVASHLINRGFHVAFLGSIDDLPLVKLCTSSIPYSNRLHVFTGQFSLLQLAAFFDHCRLLITNDSGPMHIAAARNLPALSIFGSSPTIGFSPRLHSHTILFSSLRCQPCYKQKCEGREYMKCMKIISPEVVIKYALEMLAQFDKPAKDLPIIEGAYDCKIIDLAKQN
ncbi:MAG: glycosyltransferase family 9 protein [Selenomonadaceae bacterium]|nr:glycosyltransferase family 9 protein [Selenomonadaceae bacterium]